MLPRMHFSVASSSRALEDSLLHLSSSAESEACCVCSISRHRAWQEKTHELHISRRQTWTFSSTATAAGSESSIWMGTVLLFTENDEAPILFGTSLEGSESCQDVSDNLCLYFTMLRARRELRVRPNTVSFLS